MTEYFDVIDEKNEIVGKASREECHKNGLWHRAVHIIIVNSEGKILLQKRSMKKDLYKGYWIDAAAGHVDHGESYEETAERELEEELGIKTRLVKLFDFKKYTGNDNEIIRVFGGKHDGLFKPNRDEMDKVEFFTLNEINKMLKTEKFTPGTVEIFREINKNPDILKRLGSL